MFSFFKKRKVIDILQILLEKMSRDSLNFKVVAITPLKLLI